MCEKVLGELMRGKASECRDDDGYSHGIQAAARHTSHVTRRTSHVTRHTSHHQAQQWLFHVIVEAPLLQHPPYLQKRRFK